MSVKHKLSSEEKIIAFGMAFVVWAGWVIRGRVDWDGDEAIKSGIDFVEHAKESDLIPNKHDLD